MPRYLPLAATIAVVVAIVIVSLVARHKPQAIAPMPAMSAVDPPDASASPAQPATPAGMQSRPLTPAARDAIRAIVASRGQAATTRRSDAAATWESAQAAYARESRDAAWAAGKERAFRSIVDDAGMQAAGVRAPEFDVQCKRTFCRIDARLESTAAADDWLMAYMSSVGDVASRSAVRRRPAPDGGVAIMIVSQAR